MEHSCDIATGHKYYGEAVLLWVSVCWSGLHGPIAYSFLGGGVPIPEHRLCGTLNSVPLRFKITTFVPTLDPRPMEVEELVLRPDPLCSTGAACAQGRLLPRASCGPVRCVGVCLGLRVRVCQRRIHRLLNCFRLLPGPLPVDLRLLPPPPGYPCAQPSY